MPPETDNICAAIRNTSPIELPPGYVRGGEVRACLCLRVGYGLASSQTQPDKDKNAHSFFSYRFAGVSKFVEVPGAHHNDLRVGHPPAGDAVVLFLEQMETKDNPAIKPQ